MFARLFETQYRCHGCHREQERLTIEETERRVAEQTHAARAQQMREENARQAIATELASLPELQPTDYATMYTLLCCCVRGKPRLRRRRELLAKSEASLVQPEREFLVAEDQRRVEAIKKYKCNICGSNVSAMITIASLIAGIVWLQYDDENVSVLVCQPPQLMWLSTAYGSHLHHGAWLMHLVAWRPLMV